MFTHIAVVRDLVAMQYKEHQEVTRLHGYLYIGEGVQSCLSMFVALQHF